MSRYAHMGLRLIKLIALSIVLAVNTQANVFGQSTETPKIVIVEFHGLKRGIIADNLSRMPHFREIIRGPNDDQAYIHLSNVLTTIPAASVPACTSMYTGLYPQNTGVVSTVWFDRRSMKTRTMRSLYQQRINRILTAGDVKTLFEYVGEAGKKTLNAMLMIDKGAEWSLRTGAFFWGNGSTFGFFKRGIYFPDPWYMDHKTISGFLDGHVFQHRKSLSGILAEKGFVPDVMVIQLLGTDIYSHFPDKMFKEHNASMDEIQTHFAVNVLDPQMGRLLRFFKANGCYRNMIFILLSQQGFLKIKKHIPNDVVSTSLKEAFKIPDFLTPNHKGEAVVMRGACTKEIYLKNRASGNWLDPPGLLTDVKPAIDLLLADPDIRGCLNELVIRQYPGERSDGVMENDVWWGIDWRNYRADRRTESIFLKSLLPLDTTFQNFELKDYVIRGLNRQYTRETAPDIKLINKKGFYFEDKVHKYGHHGSYYPEDNEVFFWVAGPGLAAIIPGRHVINAPASTLDLIPMVACLLNIPQPQGLDGKNPLADLK